MRTLLHGCLALALLAAPLLARQAAPPARIERGQTCLTCHQAMTEAHNSHSPVREGKCTLCHQQSAPERHAFALPEQPGAVCTTCHELPKRSTQHAPFAGKDCLACHSAHPAKDDPYRRNMLKAADERALCTGCHADQSGKGHAFVHGPVAAGACTLCHVPHASDEKKLLRKPANQTCLECHADIHAKLDAGASRHPPVLEGCVLCHDPHASDNRFQLAKEPKKLCLDCHGPLLADFAARPVFHQALVTDDGCANCHAAHASPFPKLLEKPVIELCVGCHSKPIERADGRTIAPVGSEIAGAKYVHGPIREGACDACHDPHGGQTFSLLREPYPKAFYAPFQQEDYGLCFRCHLPEVFSAQNTDTLTRFRDGTRNLHFLHVNREKGRTCRACHETHASDLPVHLARSVPFGTWEMPLRFERLPSGGACTPGCHDRRQYDNALRAPRAAGGQ